jgi:alpha-ketoglutarate-dependent taurine dioxygenase
MKQDSHQPGPPRFTLNPRRPIGSNISDLVTFESLSDRSMPVVAQPVTSGVNLITWAESDKERIQAILLRHGAILFRGFGIQSAAEFEGFITAVSGQPLPYLERSSPRTQVKGAIYSSTEYPADQEIFLHCENSYQKTWPLKIFFFCQSPAELGGETPIADTRRILGRIDPKVRDKFAEKGVTYVRNFGAGFGLSWQEAFQTEDPQVVTQYCLSAGIECDWGRNDRLRIKQIRKAIRSHPSTGESVWFNHAVFFHVSTLDPATQKVLSESFSEEELPGNTYYGDGSKMEPEALDHLRRVYQEEKVLFRWRQGDIMMLDNMLVAHGRSPYCGPRKILVGMTEPYSA